MGFPFIMPKVKSGDYYFGLFLKEKKGVGCVLYKKNNKIVLLAKEHFQYTEGWEHITEDVDNLLSRLESKVGCHLEKTIFFFFSHFIDENENVIKRPYSTKIKELSNALSLKAIGYIECNDAVSSYLTKYDKFPLTTILIEIDSNNLGIFIYKSGYKKLHKTVSRTDSIIEDILSVFQGQQEGFLLPSRIVLYNSSNLAEESSTIISYRWSSDLFVQTPRVEVMKEEDVLQSLITIFESQICKTEVQNDETYHPKESNTIMGFVIGEDIKNNSNINNQSKVFNLSKVVNLPKKINLSLFKNTYSSVKSLFNRSIFFPVIGIIVLLFSIFCVEFFFHKAKLTVLIPSKILQKDVNIQGQINGLSQDSVFITVSSFSAKLSESASVTGKRDIGEKSKGEVTLYNYDDKEIIIQKGTTIKVDTFSFQTTGEGKIPGATLASDASAKLPGKAKVSVLANVLGPENNLEKNKRFTVGDLPFSTVFAINELSFSGGTKSSVTTVSKKDIDDLKQILITKAKKTPQINDIKQLGKNADVLIDLTEVNLTGVISSKEVGEEGNNVVVTATAITQYYNFSREEMKKLIQSQLNELVLTGFRLDLKNIDYQIIKSTRTKNQFKMIVSVKAKALKNIDIKKIPNLIRGKQKDQISTILKSQFDLSDYSIQILPDLPLINTRLPFLEKNISLISQDL